MSMQMCPARKHYYDPSIDRECPYCAENQNAAHSASAVADLWATRANATPRTAASPKTKMTTPAAAPKTTILLNRNQTTEQLPTTGWLVIMEGKQKGRDFRLIQGENRIGRHQDMEICLDFGDDSDNTISRDTHAMVVYDPHANEFFVERGNSRNLPLLNGRTIRGEPVLQSHDIIQVGQTKLLFVPLCGQQFQW